MNSKWTITLSILAILLMASTSLAQGLKIGVVDLQTVLEKCEPGQKAITKLKKEFQGMKDTLDKKKAEVEQLQQAIQKQRLVLSQEAQIDKETEYKQKVRDFQDLYQSYQRKMRIKEKKLREPIIKKLVTVVQEYGKNHQYTLILDKRNSGVAYNVDSIDITSQIIVELNKAWRASK